MENTVDMENMVDMGVTKNMVGMENMSCKSISKKKKILMSTVIAKRRK